MPEVTGAKTCPWTIRAKGAEEEGVEVLLYGDIGDDADWSDNDSATFAREIGAISAKSITVRINSFGGSVFAGTAMYNTLKRHPAHVTVVVDGIAASIASMVAMAGDVVVMPSTALMMVHNPWTVAVGNAEDMRRTASELDTVRNAMARAYVAKTGLAVEEIFALLDAETWFTADAAKQRGFCDVVEGMDPAMAASIRDGTAVFRARHGEVAASIDRFRHLPEGLFLSLAGGKQVQEVEALPMTIESIRAEAPHVYDSIRSEGSASERERIRGIYDLCPPGMEDLARKFMFEGQESPEQFAVAVIRRDRETKENYLAGIARDAAPLALVPSGETPPMGFGKDEKDEGRRNFLSAVAERAKSRLGVK